MKKIFHLAVFVLIFFNLKFELIAQIDGFPRKIYAENYSKKLDSIKQQFKYLGEIPEKFKLPVLIALSPYEEIKNCKLQFREKKIAFSMTAKPKIFSLFRKKSKRIYCISINSDSLAANAPFPEKLPLNAQIGLISHELAHIVDYNSKSSLSIIWDAITYFFPKKRKKYERATDFCAIEHGFAWQLYDFSSFVLNCSEIPESYKKKKRKFYIQAEEIPKLIDNLYFQPKP